MTFARLDRAVPRVVGDADAPAIELSIALDVDQIGNQDSNVVGTDALSADARGDREVGSNAISQPQSTAQAVFVPVEEPAIVEEAAGRKADRHVTEKVRVGELHRIAIEVAAGRGFGAKRLPGSAKCGPAEDVAKRPGPPCDVKVPFVDRDLSGHSGVTVDRTAEHDSSGPRRKSVDDQVRDANIRGKNGVGADRRKCVTGTDRRGPGNLDPLGARAELSRRKRNIGRGLSRDHRIRVRLRRWDLLLRNHLLLNNLLLRYKLLLRLLIELRVVLGRAGLLRIVRLLWVALRRGAGGKTGRDEPDDQTQEFADRA